MQSQDLRNGKGRAALVTGGASGIGRAVAERLAADGLAVMVVDRDPAGAQVAEAIGGRFQPADLAEAEACFAAVDATVAAFGRLDVLVNVAGFQSIHPLPEFPLATWDAMLRVMVTAPHLLTQRAWPQLAQSGSGRVVHLGSAHSSVASPFKAGYVTAKHALLGHMRAVALEGGPLGITCNLVAPGYVRTPLVAAQVEDQARTRGIPAERVEEEVFLARSAVKRMPGPAEVAAEVAWLASPEAWAVNGSVRSIDGGWTAS